MTALVGILNRRAVAITADSALTVSNRENTEIYNTVQKIFKLSEKNPVAVITRSGGFKWIKHKQMFLQVYLFC